MGITGYESEPDERRDRTICDGLVSGVGKIFNRWYVGHRIVLLHLASSGLLRNIRSGVN